MNIALRSMKLDNLIFEKDIKQQAFTFYNGKASNSLKDLQYIRKSSPKWTSKGIKSEISHHKNFDIFAASTKYDLVKSQTERHVMEYEPAQKVKVK